MLQLKVRLIGCNDKATQLHEAVDLSLGAIDRVDDFIGDVFLLFFLIWLNDMREERLKNSPSGQAS